MKLQEILSKLKDSEVIAFDFETTDLHHKLMEIDGVSFASDKLEPVYLRWNEYDSVELREFMLEVFSLPALFIAHNLQFDAKILKYFYGIVLPRKFDTMIASWYLDENRPKGLKDLGRSLLQIDMQEYKKYVQEEIRLRKETALEMAIEELGEKATKKAIKERATEIFEELPVNDSWMDEYGARDAEVALKLYHLFNPMLEKEGLSELFLDLEMPFIDVLINMTLSGICVDVDLLKEMEKFLIEKKTRIENRIYASIGEFNIGSSQQLSEKLFGIRVSRKAGRTVLEDAREAGRDYVEPTGYTKAGAPSTNEKALNKLPDTEVVKLVKEYRATTKLLTTYATGYQKFVVNGKIYPNFNGVGRDEDEGGTVTGRLSSSQPNMQNLPRERTIIETEDDDSKSFFIRDAFVAPKGYKLIVTDESQLELRILAHYSGDPELVTAFLSGQDVHTRTAQQVLGRADITPSERSYFKTINFGIMYGRGAPNIAEDLKITVEQAQEYLNGYFATYSGVKSWMDSVVIKMKKRGYVTTLIGRKRRIPEIWSGNFKVRGHAERQTVNSVIQGSAADILKVAMVLIHKELQEKNLDAQIVLQIHDELVVVCNELIIPEVSDIIQKHMEHPFLEELRVPLVAEPKVVQMWGEAKE